MQSKLSQYIRIESHSDSEGSTSGIATATDNAYQVLPSSDSPLSSTSMPLVHNNGELNVHNNVSAAAQKAQLQNRC